jgi:hypothetical protein
VFVDGTEVDDGPADDELVLLDPKAPRSRPKTDLGLDDDLSPEAIAASEKLGGSDRTVEMTLGRKNAGGWKGAAGDALGLRPGGARRCKAVQVTDTKSAALDATASGI